MGVDIASS